MSKPKSKAAEYAAAAKAKLAESGLSLEDAKELGMEVIPPATVKSISDSPSFLAIPALKINYYGMDGKPLSDVPSAEQFFRLRYLGTEEEGAEVGFGTLTKKKKKFPKYVQAPGTFPCAYFPKTIDWSKLNGSTDSLIFTEGELKAACACKHGFPAVGICGVYNWRAINKGVEWIESLEGINLLRRNVYVIFDSDYREKEGVLNALRLFCDMLEKRGAIVFVVTLPTISEEENAKTGLDDFLEYVGHDGDAELSRLLHISIPYGLTRTLWKFNGQYCYVRNPGLIIEQETKAKISPDAFKSHRHAAQTCRKVNIDDDGNPEYELVAAGPAWISWPTRLEVSELTYSPGAASVIETPYGRSQYNIWDGWGCEPRKGEVKLFKELIDHIFDGAEKHEKEWFLRWCAYPLQFPGTKMFTSAVIHGIVHGTGKSLIGYTLGQIYGKNFSEISQMDLHNTFNEWAEAKQFVMGDDVTGSDKRADADFLKKLITQRELRVNAKFIPSYVVPDCINYFFTSNSPDAFFLEDRDRRFFIHEVLTAPKEQAFYRKYSDWLFNKGGSSAVFDYLLNLPMGNFDPAAPALMTVAKESMIEIIQSDLGAWCRNLRDNPDSVLKVGSIPLKRDLYTSQEILTMFYDPMDTTRVTATGLAREIKRVGFRAMNKGRQIRMTDGTQKRYYALRNESKWIRADERKLRDHIEEPENTEKKKKSKY